MLSKDPAEELAKYTTCNTETAALRTRFDDDFGRFRNDLFTIPGEEGKWDSFTSNRASSEADDLIAVLSSSRVKIWIPLSDEDKKKRKNLYKTEQFIYGAINLRDSIFPMTPGVPMLHEAMSWFAPVRGWMALLCYLYEGEDGRKGQVISHIMPWDIYNTRWIPGAQGLSWACYQRWANVAEVSQRYKKEKSELKPDDKGRILLYDAWDDEEEGVIVNGEYLMKRGHFAKHVPVLILPCGATPLIQSENSTDNIKHVGESWARNNRHLYDAENRMGSYAMTLAGRTAKTPMFHEYDSTKAGTRVPTSESSPFEKGSEVYIDVGIGEKITPGVTPEMTRDFYAFQTYINTQLDNGSKAPASLSRIHQPQTAAGMNIARKLSEIDVMPFKRVIERSYEWLAHELVSQYKNGGFKKMEIQGIDGSNRRFKMEVSPKDIDDSWQFKAELLTDFPMDEMANTGMAVQLKEAELAPVEWIQDKLLHMEDTDGIRQKMDREKVLRIASITMRRVAADLADPDGENDPEGAQFVLDEIERMKAEQPGVASQPRPRQAAPQPGVPSPVRPSADTSAVVPKPPKAGALRRFLSRLGGGR